MKRILIITLLAGVSAGLALGQTSDDTVIRMKNSAAASGDSPAVEQTSQSFRGTWNLTAGTSFIYSPAFGSGMGFYAAPTYTLPVSDRWSLHAGVVASSFTGLQTPELPDNLMNHQQFSGLSVFAAASYRMNDRLILHGSGTKQLVSAPMPFYPSGDQFTLGATYRLGDNVTIGASVRVRNHSGFDTRSPFATPAWGPQPLFAPYGW